MRKAGASEWRATRVKGLAVGKKAEEPKAEAFVLDGSVTLAWYFKDEANPYADAIASRFPDVQAVVPAI